MADQKIQSTFPKMGEGALEDFVNVSGDRSPYTHERPRQGTPSSDSMDGGTALRGRTNMTGESNGPKFNPQTMISWTNDPVAHATGRGLRTVSGPGFFQPVNEGQVISE